MAVPDRIGLEHQDDFPVCRRQRLVRLPTQLLVKASPLRLAAPKAVSRLTVKLRCIYLVTEQCKQRNELRELVELSELCKLGEGELGGLAERDELAAWNVL
jgi:hypothetical protein